MDRGGRTSARPNACASNLPCVGTPALPPLEELEKADFDVTIDGDAVDTVESRGEASLRCSVENRTRVTLASDGPNPVQLSYRTFLADTGELVEEGARTPLEHSLAPGETRLLDLRFVAPAAPNRYLVEVTLVRELVAWFRDVCATSAYTFDVEVVESLHRKPPKPLPPEGIPLPPLEMRRLVGPTDPAYFENTSGGFVEPLVPPENYESVFDFGCGCGRLARQLLQQHERPRRYLGIDLHAGMISWCRQNLTPIDDNFEFLHHDVRHPWNPGDEKPRVAPFPALDNSVSLVLAHSVFTHLTEDQANHYLAECARVLKREGVVYSTWFLFDKSDFPMLHDSRNALYADYEDPSGVVIFAKEWLKERSANVGLAIYAVEPPAIRGFHWRVLLTPDRPGVEHVDFPRDDAPFGREPAPLPPENPAQVGIARAKD
jgi:SAM-dependent methyltransferase